MKKILLALCVFAGVASFAAPLKIVSPAAGSVQPTLTEGQKKYATMPQDERRKNFCQKDFRQKVMGFPAEKIEGHKRAASWPKMTRLEWTGGDEGCEYAVKVVEASTGKLAYENTVKDNFVYIDNLKLATEYKWTVTAGKETAESTFKTEDIPPRIVRINGVGNVRDIGGYIGLGGKRVKQGLIYRSAELNYSPTHTYYTKEELIALGRQADWEKFQKKKKKRYIIKTTTCGKSRMSEASCAEALKYLGIKTDIDIRNNWETAAMTNSPFGSTVNWVHAQYAGYDRIHKDSWYKSFNKIFSLMLDEKNYPFVFHCRAGQDRTGALAYILLAILGVNEEMLSLDWEMTGLYNRGWQFNHERLYDKIAQGFLKNCKGNTVMERAIDYVKKCGFTDADIEKFRELMLEK